MALAVYTLLLSVHLLVRRSLVAADGAAGEREHGDVWMRAPRLCRTSRRGKSRKPTRPPPAAPRSPAKRSRAGPRLRGPRRAGRRGASCRGPVPPIPSISGPKQEPSLSAPGRLTFARRLTPRPPRQPGAAQPEMSVELIQDLIKKLADELNTTHVRRARREARGRQRDRGHDRPIGGGVAGDCAQHAGSAWRASTPRRATPSAPDGGVRIVVADGRACPRPPSPARGRRAHRRRSIPGSRPLPKPWRRSAWRCCSSRSTPLPRAGRAISR